MSSFKTILKLNEERELIGLKLLSFNDGLVIVSESMIGEDEWFLMGEEIIQNSSLLTEEFCKSTQPKVLFATDNLNLKGVPHIRRKVISENSQEYQSAYEWVFNKNGHKWSNNNDEAGDNFGSFLEGYKKASQFLFTEDQLMDAMSFSELYIIEKDKPLFLKSNGNPTKDCLDFIKSLKQPKVEITFIKNQPVECKLL